jgi:hypothetical protein
LEPESNRGKNTPDSPVRVIVESLPPSPPASDEQKADEKRKKRFKWGKLLLEILALGGLLAYVHETFRTNNLTHQALKDERMHFSQSQRPWVGMVGDVNLLEASGKELFKIVVGYKLKNFGPAPALNTVVWLEPPIGDANNYALIKTKVEYSCRSGENLVTQTGDLLLPNGEKPDTWTFGEKAWPPKFVIPGCAVYRDTAGGMHHTQLCYWTDLSTNPKPKTFSTCWFQAAD